jgi:hypothetical protein
MALLIIVVAAAAAVFIMAGIKPAYSDNPSDWLSGGANGSAVLSFEQATKGGGRYDPAGEKWNDGAIVTNFAYDGLYRGEYFSGGSYENEKGETLLSVTPEMAPGNGIPEGIIVERIEDNLTVKAFIFLDSDWKVKIGDSLNILWGAGFNKTKKFSFREISPGIYMDTITDDRARFNDDFSFSEGGIAVGDASAEDVASGNSADITVIRAM